jgi:hypothetical protein
VRDLATLFDNVIALISGDSSLKGAANFEKFAKAVGKAVHWLAMAVHLLLQIEGLVTGIIGGGGAGGVIGSIVGGVLGIPGGPAGIAGGIMAGGATGTAIGAGVGGASGAVFDLLRHMKVGPWAENDDGGAPTIAGVVGFQNSNLRELAPGDLMDAIRVNESGGQGMRARSSKGAIGDYQLMPATARALGVNPYDAADNKRGAYTLMQQLLQHYHNNLPEAIGAYNWNPRGMDAFLAGKATMPAETSTYIARVLRSMGGKGDVQVGSITIHIDKPGLTNEQVGSAVVSKIQEYQNKRTQRNLAEFADLSPSY